MIKISKLLREMYPTQTQIFRKILREVKQSGEIHIVLDCDPSKIRTVLKEAQAVGMMTAYHNYLITNLVLVYDYII